jgi:integrase
MSMHEIEPGVWSIDIRQKRNGALVRRRETFRGGKKTAEERHAEARKALKTQADSAQSSLAVRETTYCTFNEVLDFYKQHHAGDKARAESYFKRLRAIGETPLNRLSKVFKDFIRLERQSISARTGKTITVATVNKLKVFAHAALNYAASEEMIAASPLRGVRRERETPRWVNLTETQELQLLKAVSEESPDLLWFVAFALEVPCRRGEMLQAGRECFDSFSNTITLPGSQRRLTYSEVLFLGVQDEEEDRPLRLPQSSI